MNKLEFIWSTDYYQIPSSAQFTGLISEVSLMIAIYAATLAFTFYNIIVFLIL